MASMADFLENLVNLWVFKNTAVAVRGTANCSVALYTAAPSDVGGGTEVTGGNYARVAVTNDTGWTVPATPNTPVLNVADIVFPTANASWGTITHAALLDSGGNFLFWGALTTPRLVNSGDSFKIAVGQFSVLIDN